MIGMRRGTCRNKLAVVLDKDKELFSQCLEFMLRIKEARHLKILTRHLRKFDRLQHKHFRGVLSYSNNNVNNSSLHNRNTHNSSNNAVNDIKNMDNYNNCNNNGYNSNNTSDNNNNNHRGDSDINKNSDDTKIKWVINMSNTASQI